MKYWNTFKDSWRLDNCKRFSMIFLFDIIFFAITGFCIMIYMFLINKQAELMQGLIGTEDLASYLASASAAEINFLTGDMRVFLLTLIIGAVIVFVAGLFSYSLSRSLIWNYLLKKRFSIKRYLKFNVLNLILFIAFLIIFAIYGLLMILSRWVFGIILIFFLLAIIYFIFSLNIEFTKTGRIFHSIGNSFKRMDKKVYLLSLPVFIIMGIVLSVLNLFIAQILYIIIVILINIAFLSWMRIFVLETQKDKKF
jgi:hypothetical protein